MYAVSAACVFTFVPIVILKLDAETAFVNSLKYIAATLGVPGAFIGLIAASGRIDDIDLWITGAANFAFYFAITWLLLKLFGQGRRKSRGCWRNIAITLIDRVLSVNA